MTDEAAGKSKSSAETIDEEKVSQISPPQESAADVSSDSVDVDQLLDDVSSALDEVNEQVPDSSDAGDAGVDQLLSDLEDDVDSLSQEVEDSVSIPEPGTSDEIVDDGSEQVDQAGDVSESTSADVMPDEDVDSTLAALIDGIEGVDDESQSEPALDATEPPAPQVTSDDEQIAEDEINDIISDIDPEQLVEAQSSTDDEHPEEKAEGDEKTAEAEKTEKTDEVEETAEVEETSEADKTDESEETEDTEENIESEETDESDESPTEAADADQQTAEVVSDIYSSFSRPIRIMVKLLAIANKPFAFVPEKVKTILGLVALVTCIVTLFTTAMIIIL